MKPKIAIAAARGIGDALITLVLANNLVRNGFEVTLFSNPISQLNEWFPAITILPYPKKENLHETLAAFDLTLSDAYSEITKDTPQEDFSKLARQYVFFCMAKFDRDLVFDMSKIINEKFTDTTKREKLLPLVKATGVVINRLDDVEPMAGRVAIFCEQVLKLENVTKENGLVKPQNCQDRKYPKRIIIHPTSSNDAKNWSPEKYIKLGIQLKELGWEPVFTLSPAEEKEWTPKLDKAKLKLVIFDSLHNLTIYINESGYMIGSDSGVGHLASNVGIPTCTICRSRNPHFRWRPGWAPGIVIKTKYKLKFFGKVHWQWLISVKHVLRVWEKFVEGLGF